MSESKSWLKVIHATGCDEAALERLVADEMPKVSCLRVIGAAPRGDPLAYWRRIGETLAGPMAQGAPAPQAEWKPVRADAAQAEPMRGHMLGQPLHSDCALGSDGEGLDIALSYLERAGRHAGESLFVDAATVAAWAAMENPILMDALTRVPVLFDDGGHRPILSVQGERLKIRWNYARVAPGQGRVVDSLKESFRELLEDMVSAGQVAAQRLVSGDALFLRSDEVLIGAARPATGRVLWATRFARPAAAKRQAA